MKIPFEHAADRLLAAVVESSDDAIVAKDLTGTILSWNRAAERMFGYSAAEAVGQSILIIIPEDRRPEEDEVLRRVRAGVGISHFETVRRRKDGTLLDISLTVSPIRNDAGEVIGASKIARDITDSRRLARQLDEASRLKDEFLATLSHELRTPLNAIAGYARMLRAGMLDEERRERAVEIIDRNTATLSTLVSDLLDISAIVSGKLRLKVQQCDIIRVVDLAIESVRPAIDAKGIRLGRIVDEHAGPVWGDPDRLQQVFWNLLTNAVKFTPRGGRIQVRVVGVDSQIEFAIADTGIGIDEEFLPHVFERFRQADARMAREFGGLGVGLALVRHFVELHGGTVEAESRGRGTGATFRVRLPVMIVHRQAVSLSATGERLQRDTDHLPLASLHVVAVDDDPDSLILVADVLQMAGAEVMSVGSGAEALAAIARNAPDVVIADLGMPGMDGYEFIRRLRASGGPGRAVPAAALTAFARAEDRTRSLLAGFQMHLSKPIDPAELVAAVAALARTGRPIHNS